VRIATEAAHLKIPIARIQRIADCRGWLRGTLQPQHAFVPSLAREPIGVLAGSPRLLRCGTDRTAVDRLSRLRAPSAKMGPQGRQGQAARPCGPTTEKADCKIGPDISAAVAASLADEPRVNIGHLQLVREICYLGRYLASVTAL
jgi:hypothetical protein